LLLDEPTVGVDPQSRERILAMVRRYADSGTAVIYSTHYMEEAERICDRVLLIDRGRLIAGGAISELIARGGSVPRMELTCRGEFSAQSFDGLPGVRNSSLGEQGQVMLEMESLAPLAEVLENLRARHVEVIDFSLHSPNLADAFMALTGKTLRDSASESA
jgi:ABC-2 type transport system ATP-binding protein